MRTIPLILALLLGGCITVLPTDPIVEDPVIELPTEACVLKVTLEVVRSGNEYWTNELDIWDNKLGLDCRRVKIVEKWEVIPGFGLLLFTHETWDCYDCPDKEDTFNAAAAIYVNEWF